MLKKILLFASLPLVLVSCKGEESDIPSNGVKKEYYLSYLLTSLDGSEQPTAFYNVPFTFKYEYDNNTITVGSSRLEVNGNKKISFDSDAVKFTSTNYENGSSAMEFSVAEIYSKVNGVADASGNISDLNCLLTNNYYCPDEWRFNDRFPLGDMIIMNAVVGEKYKLRTFPLLSCFSGSTTTSFSMGGQEQQYNSESGLFAVSINPANNTAEVGLYNVKFAAQMPQLTMFLKDLKVEYTNEGYVVSAPAEGVVPVVGNDQIPYPDYIFNTFNLVCSGDNLASIDVDFTVAGRFGGEFQGTYTPLRY